jgi:hypothetical protein
VHPVVSNGNDVTVCPFNDQVKSTGSFPCRLVPKHPQARGRIHPAALQIVALFLLSFLPGKIQITQSSWNYLSDFVVFPFLQANTQGTPVVRPMWYQFPKDNETYTLNEQFMIGESLMVCPVMVQDDTETNTAITVYFPSGTWFVYQLPVWGGIFSPHHRAL